MMIQISSIRMKNLYLNCNSIFSVDKINCKLSIECIRILNDYLNKDLENDETKTTF